MNGIQGTKPDGRHWNILIDAVFIILKYNKNTIDHAIYIKVFTDRTVSYLTISTNNFLNNNNIKTAFTELTRVLKITLWQFLIPNFFCYAILLLVSVLIIQITSWNW